MISSQQLNVYLEADICPSCSTLILDHTVDQEADKLLLLCLSNLFSLVKEV